MSSTTNSYAYFLDFSKIDLFIVDLFESGSKQGPNSAFNCYLSSVFFIL